MEGRAEQMNKLKALIIDDNREVAGAFSDVLRSVGFDCEKVLFAKDALTSLAVKVPDLILLDMRLGQEIGGEDILQQIRANPRFDNTRVIIVTAYPEVAELVTDLADLVLLKPVDVDQLSILSKRMGALDIKPRLFQFRDPATQLFNQEFFITRLEHAFARDKRRQGFLFAIILFRLLFPKQQESQIQSEAKVKILQEAAGRLRGELRSTDTIARFSEWEFAILVEEFKQPEDVQIIVHRIQEKLAEPYQVGTSTYKFTVKHSAIIYNQNYKAPKDMLETASQAL
jgi:diguanylate cyclase (GGDEF)-like protein